VTFTVTSGPDAGLTRTGVTNTSGLASFSFTGAHGPGTDVLAASFTDPATTQAITSNQVWVIWHDASGIAFSGPPAPQVLGSPATVTATVNGPNGQPEAQQTVTFTIVSGPDAGANGTAVSDANGHATFTFADTIALGTDAIQASFMDNAGVSRTSNQVVVTWIGLTVTVPQVSATEGAAFSGTVAMGASAGTTKPFTASIHWGDGVTTPGSVTLNPDGTFSVSGLHTYAEEGSYPLSVLVQDAAGHTASGFNTATVADAPLSASGAVTLSAGRNGALAAAFTDADPCGTVMDYQAMITWGDGSTSTVWISRLKTDPVFVLAGAHHYTSGGTFTITLTIKDSGGASVTITRAIVIK
jgi:hypothetical protein